MHTGWPLNLLLGVLACALQCPAAEADTSWSCSYSVAGRITRVIQFRLSDGVLIGNYRDHPEHTWSHQTTILPDGVIQGKSTYPFFLSDFVHAAPPMPVFPDVKIDPITGMSKWFQWPGLCSKD